MWSHGALEAAALCVQGLQAAREGIHVDFSERHGIWMLSQHRHVLQLLDNQAAALTRVRQSDHSELEHTVLAALRAHDESLRSIVQTIDTIVHVCSPPVVHVLHSRMVACPASCMLDKLSQGHAQKQDALLHSA